MSTEALPTDILRRKAVVYVRQSTQTQVQTNLESQRRQYDLVELARHHGFANVEVIDDDLGRSASGSVARPGFERLVAAVCAGEVGAVLCLDASRLARNGRDWHHLLELCGLVKARVIDTDGIYDPGRPNDRLLLGMKGSISEFELNILRVRMLDAKDAKARRGELRLAVPIGYLWDREVGLGFDPDLRVQEAIRLIFARFRQLGSARQVLLSLAAEQMHFPRPSDGKRMVHFEWTPIRYRNIITALKNPFYAGAYIYGKTEHRTALVDGRVHTTYKHHKAFDRWGVVIQGHHEAYIGWDEFERNQKLLAANAYGKAGGTKSGRGGRALLPGMLRCGACGRRLSVAYSGRTPSQAVYRCERGRQMLGRPRCMAFGAKRVDVAVAHELVRAVEPLAIEAALQAEREFMECRSEQRHIVELELEQARYEASLAERRYAACDPDNRLIAAQLEKSWEATLVRVQTCEVRLAALAKPNPVRDTPDFVGLAGDLEAAWNAPGVTMRARQQLLRALIADIIANYDASAREIVLTIHWRGGQHSELRVRKPKPGEHGCRTSDEAVAVIRSMAARWSDADIAATLNRMGLPTGQGKTWNAQRVGSLRRVRNIAAFRSAEKNGDWLTLSEAAAELGISHHQIRRLIQGNILAAEQVVAGAPYQIRATDLADARITAALAQRGRPRRGVPENQTSMFSTT
ncbi:MAG TPA: recombinase family protein [Nevskiaceae bacterium]|nr:recombinase family protein [Nevskiaceae bacterium]